MLLEQQVVANVPELVAAVQDGQPREIIVHGRIGAAPSLRLAPGQRLIGEDADAAIVFTPDGDGVQLTADNHVRALELQAAPWRRAIFNDSSVSALGTLELVGVRAVGQVQLLARNQVRAGHVIVDGLDVRAADTRAATERPQGFGVSVLQGAFTLWNMQPDPSVTITARLIRISAGREGEPVLGSGVFVAGADENGGRLVVERLETGPVFSDGRIDPGTPDLITGGVFTLSGAVISMVCNQGPVVTYGVNDMVLDNWGRVETWLAEAPLTSHGPSGIGFVNFGVLDTLRVLAPIETFGQGARGFNVYAGTVGAAEFDRITTHADGAVGIQLSRPIGRLTVRRGVETFGGTGQSLVKGVLTTLSAIGLSVKSGGSAREVAISGGIITHGLGIVPVELLGAIETLRVDGGLSAIATQPAAQLAT